MTRVGFGYDSHRLVEGRPLVLGGVRIDHPAGLTGHSDGDVLLHAVTDAVLGALAAGDIGQWFPDTDPQWKDADSATFLAEAVRHAQQQGYVVGNCDVVVLAERPKLADHREAMQRRVAELLEADPAAVGVKAKTNEQMGFVGRGEGIVAMAAVLLAPAGED
jgi:2-C-methyl-D-erythritol 2,4-cyclodiphosphate synthase